MRPHGPIVDPDGPTSARLVYLGQNTGEVEEAVGYGFAGPSGVKLWGVASRAGLPARRFEFSEQFARTIGVGPAGDAFVANAVPCRYLSGSKLVNDVTEHDVVEWTPWLQQRLPRNAKVIITVGSEALLAAATGHLPEKWRGVMDHAGSVIAPGEARGFLQHSAYVVPVPHTAYLLAGGDQFLPLVRRQMRRAAQILATGTWQREPFPPTVPWADEKHFDRVLAAGKAQGWLSIDIETPRHERPTRTVDIASFSTLTASWCFDGRVGLALWKRIYEAGIKVVGQNFAVFDAVVGARNGVTPDWDRLEMVDTLWLDALLRPRMPHRLHQVAAFWNADAPACWKWRGDTDDPEERRHYCMTDSWQAGRAFVAMEKRALELWPDGEPQKVRQDFLPVVYEPALKGLRVDATERTRLREHCAGIYSELRTLLNAEVTQWSEPKHQVHKAIVDRLEAERARLKEAAKHAVEQARLDGRAIRAAVKTVKKDRNAAKIDREQAAQVAAGCLAEAKEQAAIFRAQAKAITASDELKKAKRLAERFQGGIRPKQTDLLKEWLYFDKEGLRLPVQRHPKTKRPTTDRRMLAKLASTDEGRKHPVLKVISALARLSSVMAIHLGCPLNEEGDPDLTVESQMWVDDDGKNRITVSFHPVQMRMAAGKGDSIDADLTDPTSVQVHNIPYKLVIPIEGKEWKLNLRTQYVADHDGQLIVAADYESMEDYVWYWGMGHFIGWWDGLDALYNGVDLHSEMAAAMFAGCPSDKAGAKAFTVDVGGYPRPARDLGKAAHHAFKLGGGARMLKHHHDIPESEGRELIARIEATPRGAKIREFQALLAADALKNHRVFTPFKEFVDYWAVEKQKGGTFVLKDAPKCYAVMQQGSAANIIFRVAPPTRKALLALRDSRILLLVHDEIVTQAWPEQLEEVKAALITSMSRHWPEMPIPWDKDGLRIATAVESGPSWGAAKEKG